MTKKKKSNVLSLGLPKIQTYEQLAADAIDGILKEEQPDKIWLMYEKNDELHFVHSHPMDIVHTVGIMTTQAILGMMEYKFGAEEFEEDYEDD